jgi:hypothetical protein
MLRTMNEVDKISGNQGRRLNGKIRHRNIASQNSISKKAIENLASFRFSGSL